MSKTEKIGTGFFVRTQPGDLWLVTNRHILDLGYSESAGTAIGARLIGIRVEGFAAADGNPHILPRERVIMELAEFSGPSFPTHYDEDVACVKPLGVLLPEGGEAKVDFFVNDTDLADDAWIESKLSVSDFIVYPGFPPWHDQCENRPILRTGTIASDPRTNYSDEPTSKGRRVAFEGFSFAGSSGSPIIATQKGFCAGPGITVSGFRESRIVGINAGHLRADMFGHSGVSYFIKSSSILELVRSA